MRNPSLHITEQNLVKLLSKVDLMDSNYSRLAKDMVRVGKSFNISNRNILITTKKIEDKVKKVISASTGDTNKFSILLNLHRKKLRHVGISSIREGSRDWDMLKTIVNQAVDFCNEFEISKEEGFSKYVELGLSKMNKFSLMKFPSLYGAICNMYQSTLEIQKDNNPEATKEVFERYVSKITEKTGIIDYSSYKNPEKYVYFFKAREFAESLGVKGIVYIDAQFYGFEWREGIPDPLQLIGDKAKERLVKYLFEKNIKINIKEKTKDTRSFSEKFREYAETNHN